MNNKQTDFYGKFYFNGKSYPFFYKDCLVTVIQKPYEYNNDFKDVTEVEKIEGLTNSNKVIVFLKCKFQGGSYKELFSNIIFSTKGFILFNEHDCSFECIEFKSEAINTFYPPISLFNPTALFHEKAYIMKNSDETTKSFETVVNQEKIRMELSIPYTFNIQPDSQTIGEKYSVWRMIFDNSKNSENIAQYYLDLLDFLMFVNFRRNVAIEHFKLYKVEDSKYVQVGIGKIFSNKSGFDAKVEKSITFNDLTQQELGNLFSCIVKQRTESSYNISYIPQNSEKYRSVTWIEWLNTALSFEGEYCKEYKNKKFEDDENFAAAKGELLELIKKKIDESGVSKNNKINKAWNQFNSLIEHTDYRLEEKFKFSMGRFKDEIDDIKQQLIENMKLPSDCDLPHEYAKCRNSLAHGSIIPMSDANIVNFILMRVLIYCFVLERADIPKDTRKRIVEKLFKM